MRKTYSSILIAFLISLLASGNAFAQVPVGGGGGSGSGGTVVGNVANNVADTGNPVKVGGVYNSSPITLDNGDRGDIQLDANGYLNVNIKAGAVGGSGGTSMTDDAAFTAATTLITPAGAMFDDVAPDSVNENDGGVVRMSANRNLYNTIRDAAGNERGANVDSSNRLTTAPTLVSGSVASGALASGSVSSGAYAAGAFSSGSFASGSIAVGAIAAGATSIADDEDVASANADRGVKILAVQRATPANTAADLDYSQLQMSAGRLWVDPSGVTLTVASHAVTNAGTFVVQENGALLTSSQLIDDGVATVASAITTKGMAAAGTDGTNARILKTDTSGELQVDVLTMPTVTINSPAVTNAGTFVVQENGAALTALQLIDNLVAAEDAVAGSAYAAVPILAVRQDSQTALAADGDFITPTIDAVGGLRVSIVAGAGSGGTAIADGATFTASSTSTTPASGFYQSSVSACADGKACAVGITTGRALKVALANADGSLATYASDMTIGTAIGTSGPLVQAVYSDFDGSALPTITNVNTEGEAVPFAATIKGVQYVMVVNEDGSLERGTTTTPTIMNNVAATSGGADSLSYNSVGTSEDEHAVKASAGTLYSITATNTNAAVRFLRCENDTAANTSPGSETPELDLAIPGATTGAGITFDFPVGYSFSTALTCWLVTGAAQSDVAEVAANELKVFYTFK